MTALLLILVALLAYANGSNDNSKGVATLVGYGAASARQALLYATLATAVGAAISFWFSKGLLKSFSTGLFERGTVLDVRFFISVLIGAFGWVIFATGTGLPVSTTHAITGALIGAGLITRANILWAFLAKGFVTPLVLGPVLALALVYLLAWPVLWLVRRNVRREVVVEERFSVGAATAPGTGGMTVAATIIEEESTVTLTRTAPAANVIHWLSGGFISFARGWNDTPKIAALALVALPGRMSLAFTVVTVAMAVGGLISGRKVLETLSRKLTPLPLPESLTASLTTAALVCLASWRGLPVSTTHVSTGAIIGAGLKHDPASVKWKKVMEIVLSWVVTLPAAAMIAAVAKWLIT